MPFLTSAWRIEVVLQKAAEPAAQQETMVLSTRSLEPVADFVIFEVSFLRERATKRADDTATV